MVKLINIFAILAVHILTRDLIGAKIHGRYTRDIKGYQLTIPRALSKEGEFESFSTEQYFLHDVKNGRQKRLPFDAINYMVTFNDANHHVELWPNHEFLSGDLVFETRQPNVKVKDRDLRTVDGKKLCHYTGRIKGVPGSRVALSTCTGLTGYIQMNGERYYIEPMKEHIPNSKGQLLHIVFEDTADDEPRSNRCGTTQDWQEAWRTRFREKFERDGKDSDLDIKTRGLESVHRYLETLVVADKKFLDFHRHSDFETYILTIMNMVSDYYHDESSGNQMDVIVVRIIYLAKEEEEIDLAISPHAEDTLASFCKWQQTVNPKDIKNPHHHDIAVLLTSYDICSDNMTSCGLLGLAYVAAACSGDKPCAINEDKGLILGIVVAHEMGHVMGCSHDEEKDSPCKAKDEDDAFYVMSPYVHMHTNVWSPCSKTFITNYLNADLGECLNDEPSTILNRNTEMLPGSMYDGDYQCQMEFPGSTVCEMGRSLCEKLSCKVSPTSCMTMGEVPADGTKCGENKWCYDKKCVEIGERPEAVNGGWGDWGKWSDCSRSCGGGVTYSERECNNPVPKHKGRYCLGDRRKVKTCNTMPCPEGSESFRSVQCSEFNNKPHQNRLYHWKPFYKPDAPCCLYCINTDNVFTKLAPYAKDGTPCKSGTKDMCVNGVCTKTGCDYVLGSNAVEDQCGVCKGDGTQCRTVENTYKEEPGHGYVKLVTIFKGCTNVEVRELAPSTNMIAVGDADGSKYFFNANFNEDTDGTKDIGGTEGLYEHPEPEKESLTIHGPLAQDIVLYVVFFVGENVGYYYKYSEPVAESTYQPHYHWEFVEWEDCSARCGGGSQISEPACIEERAGKVTATFCDISDKPELKSRKCHEEPCKTKWRVGEWGPCQACKFKTGVRIREVECVRESPNPAEDDILIDDKECIGPRPGSRELCNSHKECPKEKRGTPIDGLDPIVMRKLWFQSFRDFTDYPPQLFKEKSWKARSARKVLREIRRLKRNHDKRKCNGKENSNATLNAGAVVKDKIPPDEIKLIEVPLKQSHFCLNISDNSFETMGDSAENTLDTKHEKIYTGKEAAEKLKILHHKNVTQERYK